jgi:drug/metabolite transporter (DMT)-like permease
MVYFVLLFQSLIASGTHIVAKIAVRDISPPTLTMLRSLMAAIPLTAALMIRSSKLNIMKEDYRKIALLSFLAIPVNQFLFLLAMKYTTPANASLLYGTTPAMVLLLSFFMKKETLTLRKGLGVTIAFCGIMLVVFERGVDFRSNYTLGNALLIVAVIAWALYTVHGQPMIVKYGAFPVSALTMIIGTIMFLPIGLIGTISFDFASLTINHWGALLYLSIGTSIFAYFLWYYALGRVAATKVAIFSNLQPILTTILAILLLGQSITAMFVVGGCIALLGVILTQFG